MNVLLFQHPGRIWLIAAAALLVVVIRYMLSRRNFAGVAAGSLLSSGMYSASRVRRLPAAVAALAVLAIAIALMEPVLPFGEERVRSTGVDIAIVLDLSSSMEERMAAGTDAASGLTRLDVTKRVISNFVTSRPEDRIGLIVFSDNAYIVSPLTQDHAYLQRYIGMVNDQILRGEGMTAIGEGVTLANALLSRQAVPDSRRDRVIVILTDGENNTGRSPIAALGDARRAGYRVHMIGVDLDDEIKQKPEVNRLIRAIERQGGRFYSADTEAQLRDASRAIDSLERGTVVSSRTVRNAPAYEPFAASAILLICLALALRAVPFFVDLT